MELKLNEPIKTKIIFNADNNGSWVMKLTSEGIFFNREKYADAKPDDFAQAVIRILEKEFTVKFERNEPPYNRNGEDGMDQCK